MTQNITPTKKVGKNLKNLIKESGRTQEGFADEFGTDPTTVRRWISKGINSVETICQIAEFFDVDFRELFD